MSCEEQRVDIIKMLIKAGALTDIKNKVMKIDSCVIKIY
jgi:hypothetical protein